jgi:RNA polymerase sigma-70 factor (ECF subfamily)
MPTFEQDLTRETMAAVGHDGAHESLGTLAAKVAIGDKAAFEAIYSLMASELSGFVRSQVATDEAAEDIVAESFLRAWKYAKRYRTSSGDYRAWIFTIAKNQVRTHQRKAGVQMQTLESVENLVGGKGLHELSAISVALSRLGLDQQSVIALHYYSGCTLREIADILGKSEGSIRTMLLRALTRLREELEIGQEGESEA